MVQKIVQKMVQKIVQKMVQEMVQSIFYPMPVYLWLSSTNILKIALVSVIICIILKLDEDLLLSIQTSFVYLLRWGF